jgi:hypothetical protein
MKLDLPHADTRSGEELGIFERLEKRPDSFTDEQLEMLLRVYSHSPAKGRNAQIPAKAFLILEKRKSSIHKL